MLWTGNTIQTRPYLYWQTLIPTTSSPRSQPPNSKKLSQTLKDIKNQVGLSDHSYKKMYPNNAIAQNLMALPKYTKLVPPLGPLCPVGDPLHMEWPRS